MANSYGLVAADLRKRCFNVSSTIYSDAKLVEISEEIEASAHKRLGKSSAYDSSSEPRQYKIMRKIIKEGTAAEVLSSLDNYIEQGKDARINYYTEIKNLKSTKISIITGGPNIADELDSNNYTPEPSETY